MERMLSRKFFIASALLAFSIRMAMAAVYSLPGTCDTSAATHPMGDPRNGLRQFTRDSSGFWYVVWENGSQTDIVLAYSTTSTPLNAGGWSLVTLVDNAAGGVIGAAPANDTSGSYPSIAIGLDDVLHLVWKAANTSGTCYYATCTTAAGVATAGNWSTPLLVSTNITDYSFALDSQGTPHLAGRGVTVPDLMYTKYDTATTAWLAETDLSSTLANNTAALDSVNLAVDLDNNIFVAWRPGVTSTSTIYMKCSSNADSVAPASSTWLNLAQTTTTPDNMITTGINNTPAMTADASGFVQLSTSAYSPVAETVGFLFTYAQLMGVSRTFPAIPTVRTSNASRSVGSFVAGTQACMLYVDTSSNLVVAPFSPATYRTRLAGPGVSYTFQATATTLQGIFSASSLPRDIDHYLWFGFDATGQKIVTSDSGLTGLTGWSPPSQSARRPHPHLAWACPSGTLALPGAVSVPIVTHTSKSAVYVVDGTSQLYAVDTSTGAFARSYTLKSAIPRYVLAATYSGNVHLYIACNVGQLLALIDDGTTLSKDPNWGNNPKIVGNATGNVLHSLAFNSESGTRYLYMMASVNTTHVGINKISADNGNDVTGFPAGTEYSPNGVESLLRVINDNVYMAGNTSQVYRRGADGSAETMSSAVANAVRHLLLWRNSNDLYVSPDGNYVYRLTSGLLTNTWTSGQSASPGTVKTSGAQFNQFKSFIFMGVGNQLYKVNTTDGSLISNTPMATTGNIATLPFQWKSYVYFGTDTGTLYAVNASDPTAARGNWPVTLPSAPSVTVMVVDTANNVVYAVANKRLYRLTLE